jgi:hypothetical protein
LEKLENSFCMILILVILLQFSFLLFSKELKANNKSAMHQYKYINREKVKKLKN